MAYQPNGFIPTRTISGTAPLLRWYPVKTSGSNVFVQNAPVILNKDGTVSPLLSSSTAGSPVIGVITALALDDGTGNPKPMTFQAPYLAANVAGFAEVNVSKDQIYEAALNGALADGATYMSQNVNMVNGTNDILIGASTAGLDTATIATTATLPFKIIGIAPTTYTTSGERTTPQAVGAIAEVIINNHPWYSTTGIS